MFIHLEDVSKVYSGRGYKVHALNHISLDVERGEMIAVMGVSGSGKSTLLNILGCMDKSSEGRYYLKGREISTYSAKQMARLRNEVFGFVFQDFALIERYTVARNVELPLYYSKAYRGERQARVEEILARVGILDKKDQLALHLSGGQRQRTAIARALINNAEILLCDEPTGALDQRTGGEIVGLFKELNRENKTIIIVTHDRKVAEACDRIIEISDGCLHTPC